MKSCNTRALSAECGVKALEWTSAGSDGLMAITTIGDYEVWSSSINPEASYWKLHGKIGGTSSSLDAAKAAAQSDFDQRIRSALAPGVAADAGERISRLAADLVTSGWMAGDHGIEKAKQDAERKLLEFACDEIKRHMASNPVHPNAAVREALGKPYAWAHPTAVARMTCSTLVMERWRKETGLQPKPLFSDMPQSNDAISAIHDAIVTLDQMCDGSNWPESAQNGDGFRSYTEACEIAATLADELRTILSGLGESSTSSDGGNVPLADHDDIGRKVFNQPWDVQKAVVTIAAHCRSLVDDQPTGPVADHAGCISQCCLELANALNAPAADREAVAREALVSVRNWLDTLFNEPPSSDDLRSQISALNDAILSTGAR